MTIFMLLQKGHRIFNNKSKVTYIYKNKSHILKKLAILNGLNRVKMLRRKLRAKGRSKRPWLN
jgi:hypothetical protein